MHYTRDNHVTTKGTITTQLNHCISITIHLCDNMTTIFYISW